MKTSGIKFIFLFSILSCIGAIALAADSSAYFGVKSENVLNHEIHPVEDGQSFFNQVQNEIPCPDFLKEEFRDARVRVILRTTAQGKVLIEQVLSDDERLVNYIKSRLHGKYFQLKESDLDRVFRFSIRFKVV